MKFDDDASQKMAHGHVLDTSEIAIWALLNPFWVRDTYKIA